MGGGGILFWAFHYYQSELKCYSHVVHSLFYMDGGMGAVITQGWGCYYELFRVFIVIYIQKVILSGEEISCINDILNNLDRKNVPVCEVNIKKTECIILQWFYFSPMFYIKICIWCFIFSVHTTVHFVVVVKINNQD